LEQNVDEPAAGLASYHHRARRGALAAGFFMMATAVLLNDWVVSAFAREYYFGKIPPIIYYGRGLVFIAGLATVIFRGAWPVRSVVGRAYAALEPVSGIMGFILIFYLLAETGAHAIMFHRLEKNILQAALMNVGYVNDEIPEYVPHLFRNYIPNAASEVVNQYGFRWGGGEKKTRNRILCVGGSTTWGWGIDVWEETYPVQLEDYLRQKGYDVDTINAGVQYYSSAEDLTGLLFTGLYTHPDIVIIYTGVNDVEAILSPGEYKPDYSHWRAVDAGAIQQSPRVAHKLAWSVPSWMVRLAATLAFKPDGFQASMVCYPLYNLNSAVKAGNVIDPGNAEALYVNTVNMVAAVRAHGASPVLVDFNIQVDHPFNDDHLYAGASAEEKEKMKARWKLGSDLASGAIRRAAKTTGAPLIPYSGFKPVPPGEYFDFCHLNPEGARQMAAYFGDFIIEHGLLKK